MRLRRTDRGLRVLFASLCLSAAAFVSPTFTVAVFAAPVAAAAGVTTAGTVATAATQPTLSASAGRASRPSSRATTLSPAPVAMVAPALVLWPFVAGGAAAAAAAVGRVLHKRSRARRGAAPSAALPDRGLELPADEAAATGAEPPGADAEQVLLSASAPKDLRAGDEAGIKVRVELDTPQAAPLDNVATGRIVPDEHLHAIVTVRGDAVTLTDRWVKELRAPEPGRPSTEEFSIVASCPGESRVTVQFMQGSASVGVLSFAIAVAAATAADSEPAQQKATCVATPAAPGDERVVALCIDEIVERDRVFYRYWVNATGIKIIGEFDSPEFKDRGTGAVSAPKEYVKRIYRQLVDGALANADDRLAFEREVRAIGADLSEQLFDDEFAAALFEARDGIDLIQVTSNEPYIPWELLRIKHPGMPGPTGIDERFFAEHGLVRDVHGFDKPAVLGARDWSCMVGEYPNASRTPVGPSFDPVELALADRGVSMSHIAPAENALLDALGSPAFDVLHMACHGSSELDDIEDCALIISDKRVGDAVVPVSVRPADVTAGADFTRRRPLVFLNACESGRQAPSLTDLGGWPRAFLGDRPGMGVGALIGTSWSVRTEPAAAFAASLYGALLDGSTLAGAAAKARASAKEYGDASWLAYTVYGRATARFEPVERKDPAFL